MPVDVLIQTHNEQLNLPYTLESLRGWVNNVFIVDSGSTDATAAIAEGFGATFVHHDWEGYAAQKNWALDNLPFESDWVLILDADEACSPELIEEIKAIVSRDPKDVPFVAYNINRIFIFMGRRIKHCGYFPSWNLRLFRKGAARYDQRLVHEHMIVSGPVGDLKHLLLHEDRRGLEHFIAKHNRYSTLEAHEIYASHDNWPGFIPFLKDRVRRRRFLKSRILPIIPAVWVLRFLYMYIFKLGFLDGRAGWYLSLFISSYEFFIRMKYIELVYAKGEKRVEIHGLSVAEGQMGALASASAAAAPATPAPARAPLPTFPVAKTNTAPATHLPTADSQPPPPIPDAALAAGTPEPAGHPDLVATYPQSTTDLRQPTSATPASRPLPRSPRRRADAEQLRHISAWTTREKAVRILWGAVESTLFRFSFHNFYGIRAALLRLFGAKLGRNVRMRRSVHIEIPWNLQIGDDVTIGDAAILYCLGQVNIGDRSMISQYSHICAGTHDFVDQSFPLVKAPITIGADVWIAADVFVGPGVTISDGVVVGARSSVFHDLPEWTIAVGAPAKPIKSRPNFHLHEISLETGHPASHPQHPAHSAASPHRDG